MTNSEIEQCIENDITQFMAHAWKTAPDDAQRRDIRKIFLAGSLTTFQLMMQLEDETDVAKLHKTIIRLIRRYEIPNYT